MTDTARLYGGSLYDLAAEEQQAGLIGLQMREIRTLFAQNPDYIRLLQEPSIPLKTRQDLIEEAFGSQAHRYLVSYLKLLCERGLLREYAGSCQEYTRRYHLDHGIAEAVVTSAVPLTGEQTQSLTARLEKLSGKKISLTCKIDPSVIAGLRVELEGRLLDGTAAGRIQDISRRLESTVL